MLLPQRFLFQPQYAAPIDYQGLGKGMRLLFNPAIGPVDLVTRRVWAPAGDVKVSAVSRGKVFALDGADDYYTHTGYPELTNNIGTFFAWCPSVGAPDPGGGGHVLFSSNTFNAVAYHIDAVMRCQVAGSGLCSQSLSSWFSTTNRSIVFSSGGDAGTTKTFLDGLPTGQTWASSPVAWGAGNKVMNFGMYPGAVFDFNGTIRIAGYTDATWGIAEAKVFHENPWAIFKAPVRRLYPVSSGTTVTGTVAYTNLNDTASASGTTTITGAVAVTNANDSATATGTTTVTSSSATTNANDTAAATGSPVVVGTSATTNADDTVSATGSVGSAVTGSVAYTNLDDTVSASGTTAVTGSVAATNADDTASASGTTTVVGFSATTNADDICAAAGTAGAAEITGTVAYTNADDIATGSGTTTIVGSVATANNNDTVSAYGLVNNGTIVEAALTTGIVPADKIKKPGIPVDAPAWLKTFLETIVGRRGNKIEVPKFQSLEFSATPTKAECEALYAYANQIRSAVNDIIIRLDS